MSQIVIISNHRTGSSALAGLLNRLGINMGDSLLGKSICNPTGHFEDLDFLNHHDKIVKDWTNPSNLVTNSDINIWRELIKSKKDFGVKDPRLCILGKYFIPLLTNPKIITINRSFEASIKSLCKRNNFTYEKSKSIFNIYEKEKNDLLNNLKLPVLKITYKELIEDKNVINRICNFLDIEKKEINFINKDLNNNGY